ncbi:UNVERIFIED_CONTAM: hypothetical protein Slati_0512300 [Sesamum latifolium]|uniref:Zinc knuckle CX2CX4HX4C domain-containing protein n=1 Tax=Sesamum latifolium TaxID=2727402 RepID=A0AAW2Y077_9LAMI
MRMRVSIDVTKPLKRVFKLRTTLGDELLLSFTYEKLPNFCYLCGCLGHLSRFCELRFADDFIDSGEATPFSLWLRATNLATGLNKSFTGTITLITPKFSSSSSHPRSNSPNPTPLHHTHRGVSISGSFSPPATNNPDSPLQTTPYYHRDH